MDSDAVSDASGSLLESVHETDGEGEDNISNDGSLLDSDNETPAQHQRTVVSPPHTSKIEVEALVKSWFAKFESVVFAIGETLQRIDNQYAVVTIGSICAGSGMAEIVQETCKRVWKSNGMHGAGKDQGSYQFFCEDSC